MEDSQAAQQQFARYQMIYQQARMMSMQKQQAEYQKMELERTLEEIGKSADNTEMYQIVGPVLIRKDGKVIKSDLESQKETLDARIKVMEKQEQKILEKLKEIEDKVKDETQESRPK